MDYEILATSAIQTSISKTSRLSSYINSGDKEPSWDGNIYLHEDDKKTKKNIYKIPVQVKGKGVSKWNEDKIKYMVSIIDLKNYLHDGGTVFFVVYIDKNSGNAEQIYYSILLPKKIDELLKEAKGKSISILLYPFPQDEVDKLNVFLFFKQHREKQAIMVGQPKIDITELSQQGMLGGMSFTFSAVGVSEETIPKLMVSQREFYLYADIKGTDLSVPFEYVRDISYAVVEKEIKKPVTIDGVIYYDSYKVIYSSKGDKLKFGMSTEMSIDKENNDESEMVKSRISVKLSGNLRERTKDLKFVLKMLDSKKIEVAGIEIPANVSKTEIDNFGYEKQKENLSLLEKYCQVLDALNVKKDLELSDCGDEDFRNLLRLYKCIIEEKTVGNLKADLPIVNRIKISNLQLLIVIMKDEQINDRYNMQSFFDVKLSVGYAHEKGGKGFPTSQFCLLKSEDMLRVDNLNYDNIINDFKSTELSDGLITHANLVLLEMIKAFDVSNDTTLYDAMLRMAEWISEQDEKYIPNAVSEINRLQIIKRKREMSFEEKEILHAIIRKKENVLWDIGALILLGETQEAKKRLLTLPESEQEQIKEYPIGKFLKDVC